MTVDCAKAFGDVRIRPYSKGVRFERRDRAVSFTLEKPGDYSIEFDGYHENLHVFAQPPSAYHVKKDAPNVRYFGPGVHDAGRMEMKSGDTIFIDEGAVVYGYVFARDADDISILGRGILDMSRIHEEPVPVDPKLAAEQKRKGFAITNVRRRDCIRLEYCDRVRIDGLTIRDSLLYYIRPIGCRAIDIRNVKIIGSWRYNADGIDMHNCENVRIADCFVRTYDDAICVKGFDYAMDERQMAHDGHMHDVFKDVVIERCTIWNDWGHALEFGAETRAREIRNVTWRDCDVIRANGRACDITNCDYADICDVLYDDIRLELDGFNPKPVYSASARDFKPKQSAGVPAALGASITVIAEYSKTDTRRGRVHDVTFRNIRVTAPEQPAVGFHGYDAEHTVTNVTIEGFFLNGRDITESLKVGCGPFAAKPVLKGAACDARGTNVHSRRAILKQSVKPLPTFPSGFTLNEGREVAFTQALPRMRNALTGKRCGLYNNSDLAIPGILTTCDSSYGEFLHLLRNTINDERAIVFADGRQFMVNKNWMRDHVHTLKAMRHWEYDYAGFVNFTIDQQRSDGCILELIKQIDDDHWRFAAPESRKFFPNDNLAMCRLDIEADVEYLLVEGALYCYRVSGDDTWLARVLPKLEKAIDYMTSDPQRWDPVHGLVKRGYTIDTWDFTYLPSSGTNRMLTAETPQAIMHGDNSGVFQAMNQLAWFNDRLGRAGKAQSWRTRAEALKAAMYRYLWNGTFFFHQLPLNVPPVDAHERERLSLSAAYDMNRGLMSVDDCRKTIAEFQRRRQTTDAFAEWFTIDPWYDLAFSRHTPGDYVNGAICLFTAGELAKAAFENGYEAYGWDILTRVKKLAERDGTLYFLYDRKTAKSINAAMGPSAWGAASVLSAFDEALAGVRDTGVKYDAIRFSPRWPVTELDELRYFTGYEAVNAVVDVRYVLRENGMRYRVQSPARSLEAHILLPAGRVAARVLVNGKEQAFILSRAGDSSYVDFVQTGTGLYDIEILF